MLPPQLQNLTPQQLQRLKSDPQFQNMIRNYMQKQQMVQQQQILAQQRGPGQPSQQPVPPQQVPQQIPPNQRQVNPQVVGGPPGSSLPQQRSFNGTQAAFLQQQQLKHQQQAHMPPQQLLQQNLHLQQNLLKQQAGFPPPGPHSLGPGGVPPAIGGAVLQNLGNRATVDPLENLAPIGPIDPNNASKFTTEQLSKLKYKELSSLTEWSDALKKEGKEVPPLLTTYEELIKKDTEFLKKYALQANSSKRTIESLVRDIKSYETVKQHRMAAISASTKNQFNNSIWGEGYQGYGNGISNTATQLILPAHNRTHTRVPDISYTDRQVSERLLKRADKPQHLVPVRLEFDQERDKFKLRDTFLWDVNEDVLPLDRFVKTLMEDYKFIPDHHYHTIKASIGEQIKDFRKKPEKTMGELRIPIKIDITINNTQLNDQFEWDILKSDENDPEDFAVVMCDELNLPGEFITAISHSIREQSQLFHKALYLIGYSFDGSPIQEDEIKSRLLPALRMISQDAKLGTIVDDFVSILRNPTTVAEFTPTLSKLTQLEVERLDKEMEREARRKRRHTNTTDYNENNLPNSGGLNTAAGRGSSSRRMALHAGRGVKITLPDLSDIPKTFRTPAPSSILPGAVDVGVPDIYSYNEVMVNRSQVRNPEYKAPHEIDDPNRVVYRHDPVQESLVVKIRLRRR